MHSTAGHAAVVFARKQEGTWLFCYDYLGLNAISRPAVEPLPRRYAGVMPLHQARFGQQLLPAAGLRVRDSDLWKNEFPIAARPIRVERGTV